MIGVLQEAMPQIEQLANYGVAGLLAFVVMYVVNRMTEKTGVQFSEADRQLLSKIEANTARLAVLADTYLLQQMQTVEK